MATVEQLIKGIDDRKSQIGNLEKEIKDFKTKLFDTLYEQADVKVGDKVKVGWKRWSANNEMGYQEAYVCRVLLTYDHKLKYEFSKIKKDGTQSGQGAGIFSYDTIEKI
jgi:hypothetical protein